MHPQYIIDTAGRKLVVLSVSEFDSLMDELDLSEDIKLFDRAVLANEPSVPAEETFKKLDKTQSKQ